MERLHFESRHRYASGFDLDVSFVLGDGVTALFGLSGSGKTTVLSIIAGMLRPQSGVVRLGDKVLVDSSKRLFVSPEHRRIGLVSQDTLLFPHLTVEQNLRFGQRRRPGRAIDFDKVVAVLELRPLLQRPPGTLSGGQRQRTALGRAILRGPDLLLMDEPLTALDSGLKERIIGYLERVVGEWRIPTLFVSHDQTDVRKLADHVVVLEGGRVIDRGLTGTALDRAAISGMRSHPGPINLLRISEIRHVADHYEGLIGTQRFHLPESPGLAEGTAWVTILPSGVALSRSEVYGLSIRNQIHGTIRQIVPADGRVFVAVDAGQLIWTELTAEALRDLDLAVGAPIYCLIKSTAAGVIAAQPTDSLTT